MGLRSQSAPSRKARVRSLARGRSRSIVEGLPQRTWKDPRDAPSDADRRVLVPAARQSRRDAQLPAAFGVELGGGASPYSEAGYRAGELGAVGPQEEAFRGEQMAGEGSRGPGAFQGVDRAEERQLVPPGENNLLAAAGARKNLAPPRLYPAIRRGLAQFPHIGHQGREFLLLDDALERRHLGQGPEGGGIPDPGLEQGIGGEGLAGQGEIADADAGLGMAGHAAVLHVDGLAVGQGGAAGQVLEVAGDRRTGMAGTVLR